MEKRGVEKIERQEDYISDISSGATGTHNKWCVFLN
jgi:hypothetical protein